MNIKLTKKFIEKYMQRAIELAKKTDDSLARPLVCALVISSDGQVVGEGYKQFVQGTKLTIHAERVAINDAEDKAKGGCLITTLEPCPRIGKHQIFSSCSELIVETGIEKVIFGLKDCSPSVLNHNSSVGYLKKKGVKVIQYTELNGIIKNELMSFAYILEH